MSNVRHLFPQPEPFPDVESADVTWLTRLRWRLIAMLAGKHAIVVNAYIDTVEPQDGEVVVVENAMCWACCFTPQYGDRILRIRRNPWKATG